MTDPRFEEGLWISLQHSQEQKQKNGAKPVSLGFRCFQILKKFFRLKKVVLGMSLPRPCLAKSPTGNVR